MFIESSTTGTGRQLVAAARRRGYVPLLLAERPDRYPYVSEDRVRCAAVRTRDVGAVRDALRSCGGERIAGICSSSEYYVALAAQMAAEFERPGAECRALDRCRNKNTQRRACRAAGVPIPDFARAETPARAADAARRLGLPVIVKPTSGSGSVGVRLCRTMDEVRHHAATLLGSPGNERGLPQPAEVLVERFVSGIEYSIEMFGTDAIGVTRKHVSRIPYFVETGHDYPASLVEGARDVLARTAGEALRAVGLTWGAAHVEARLTPAGPVIIEINPRLAGGYVPELVRLATGVDLIDATVAAVTGHEPALRPCRSAYASVRFLVVPATGRLASVTGLDAARSVPDVIDVALYRRIGEACAVHHDFRDRVGHVIAAAPSAAGAARAARRAQRAVRLSIETTAVVP